MAGFRGGKTKLWEIYNRGTFWSKKSLRALVLISRLSPDHFIISNLNLCSSQQVLKAQVKSFPLLHGDTLAPVFFQLPKSSWHLRQPHLLPPS